MSDVYEIVRDDKETEDDDIFVLVVHGFVPEFYNGVAFRFDKTYKPQRTKEIACPHCGRRFETVDAKIKVEVLRFSRNSDEICHNFRPCKICGKVVGIRYA
jgi:hypothetical protein